MKDIQIIIENQTLSIDIYIDVIKETITINNKVKKITEDKIDDLIRIIRSWNNEYNNPKMIDSETFFIKINTNEGVEIIKGIGEYPDNYLSFKEWISDLDE